MAFQKIIDELPDEYADNLIRLIQRTTKTRKGVYGESDDPGYLELKIDQGTGNDPNKPEKHIVGNLYTSNKETAGESFVGTVIALWKGRTMWGDPSLGENPGSPLCSSMDRVVGSLCGKCEDCPHLPWRDDQKQRCGDTVTAFMLSKDMKEIFLVRFHKTSEKGGQQLARFVQRSFVPWSRWYEITTQVQVSKTDNTRRWYTFQASPSQDGLVPDAIHDFCHAICTTIEATYILPRLAAIYASAQDNADPTPDASEAAKPMTPDTSTLDSMDDQEEPVSV
jgi:hypothetical protein